MSQSESVGTCRHVSGYETMATVLTYYVVSTTLFSAIATFLLYLGCYSNVGEHLLKFINHWRKGSYTCSSTYGHPIISLPSNIPLELEFSQATCDCTYHSHVTILVCVMVNVYVLLHHTAFQCNVSFFGEYIGH